jgi:putative ABC transport system permease protein
MTDLRFAFRQLTKNPGFTLVAVLTLALGIGASTVIYGVVNSLLLQPLPMRGAKRLMVLWINNLEHGWTRLGPSGLDFEDWQEQTRSFEDLFLFEHGSGTVTGNGEPEQVAGLRVTTNFGDFLGVKPVLGRTFRPEESAGPHHVALLSYGYWQRRFASDPDILGKNLALNSEAYTIIGVLPPSLWTLFPADVVVPWDRARLRQVDSHLGVIGRLRPGTTVAQGRAEMNAVAQRIAGQRPGRKGWGVTVVPLQDVVVESIRPALWILMGAVLFVLLIGCANVANLLLVRAVARRREVAIRLTLGAGRWRLIRQFMTESLLVAAVGGGLGLLVALWGGELLLRLVPASLFIPNAAADIILPQVQPDATVLVFAVVVSLGCAVGFGVIPALEGLRTELVESLKAGSRGFAGDMAGRRRQSVLVVSEIALAFVLAIGAGLMVESFLHLLAIRPGFDPEHVVAFKIKLPTDAKDSKYLAAPQRAAAFRQFVQNVQAIPGVKAVGLTEVLPLSQDDHDWWEFNVPELPPLAPGERLSSELRRVSPSFFQTMRIPLVAGRVFTPRDDRESPRVVLVDETFARRYFPHVDPLGKHVRNAYVTAQIVGVVGGVRDTGFDQAPRPTVYLPYEQSPIATMDLVVRTRLAPEALLPAVKRAVWAVDKDQPIFKVRTLDGLVAKSISPQRLAFVLLGVFALVAILLAALGIYGVISYAVERRTQEIGIRMALGATSRDVVRVVVGQGFRLAVVGIVAGGVAALGLTRLLFGLLYGVAPADPITFVWATILLGGTALLACWLPARRAAKVEPMEALRGE